MQCKACLYIADSYGDNEAEMLCQLELGHEGEHKEVFQRHGYPVTITWTVDEKEIKDKLIKESEDYYKRIYDFAVGLLGDNDYVHVSIEDYFKYMELLIYNNGYPEWDNTIILYKKYHDDNSYTITLKNSKEDIDYIFEP